MPESEDPENTPVEGAIKRSSSRNVRMMEPCPTCLGKGELHGPPPCHTCRGQRHSNDPETLRTWRNAHTDDIPDTEPGT